MSAEVESARPNIRVQIHNPEAEETSKMEVDIEAEEGEITETGDEEMLLAEEISEEPPVKEIAREVRGIFTTGINIFDKEENKKLEERAKRFALKPEEVKNFLDKDLQELHKSLGITPENQSDVKFNCLHLYGIDGISAEDILKIFENYAPDGIEYIDHNTCNVVWLDNMSAARALHYASKPVNGMPARDRAEIFPKDFLDESTEVTEEEETGQSILLKNKDREVELRQDDEIIMPQKKTYVKGAVDISQIKITIPPGYWRLIDSSAKCESILVRFGLLTDKISYRSEPFSKYYKKNSNKGIISDNKKKEIKTIFERNKELVHDKKNPWGSIAKNWDQDSKYRERSPVMYDDAGLEDPPPIEIKNPKILARLGKRKVDDGNLEDEIEFVEKIIEQKKSKMPKMKMYADEEEERIKRKKLLQKLKVQSQKIEEANKKVDLRNMLGRTGNIRDTDKAPEPVTQTDLGSRLKNRSQKMLFTLERDDIEVVPERPPTPEDFTQPDVRSILLERRNDRQRRIKIERKVTPPRKTSSERSHRSRRRDDHHSKVHTHTSERLYSDRLEVEKDKRSRVSKQYRKSSYDTKHQVIPRSRVVVRESAPKKPTVASTVWSRVKKSSGSSGESSSESDSDDSESESSSSSSESESDSDSDDDSDDSSSSSSGSSPRSKKISTKSVHIASKNILRPGFQTKGASIKDRLSKKKAEGRSPLKITTTNNRYKSVR